MNWGRSSTWCKRTAFLYALSMILLDSNAFMNSIPANHYSIKSHSHPFLQEQLQQQQHQHQHQQHHHEQRSTQLRAKGRARFSTPSISKDIPSTETGTSATTSTSTSTATATATATSFIDTLLSFLTSDLGGVIFGALGLCLCLWNRLSHLDYLDEMNTALSVEVGQQARSDLLAVFATMAVFLNGVTKLDVTSALAESVILEGVLLKDSSFVVAKESEGVMKEKLDWALTSVLDATPAKTAMLMQYSSTLKTWTPIAFAGVITEEMKLLSEGNTDILSSVMNVNTPILDRFVLDETKQSLRKETYLPTLQALPGRVEFTYLPINTQETLILPAQLPKNKLGSKSIEDDDDDEDENVSVLVLGSNTAKSFSPRDVAWCQVLAARIGEFLS